MKVRLVNLWEEDARKVPTLEKQVERENAEGERLLDEGWKVVAMGPAFSGYAARLTMCRENGDA